MLFNILLWGSTALYVNSKPLSLAHKMSHIWSLPMSVPPITMTQPYRKFSFFLRHVKLIPIFPLTVASSQSTLDPDSLTAAPISQISPAYLKWYLLRDTFPHLFPTPTSPPSNIACSHHLRVLSSVLFSLLRLPSSLS